MGGETVIVTGGAGFVGRYLIGELARCCPQWRLVVWDKNATSVSGAAETVRVDLTESRSYARQLKKLRPKWVVHLAAVAAVPAALKDPALVLRVNFEATVQLLETLTVLTPTTRVFVASSADIYGSPRIRGAPGEFRATALTGGDRNLLELLPELPLREARPSNPYAESKFKMEQVIEQRFWKRVMRVRPFPHIGPGQSLGFVTADFASQIAAIEAGKQDPVIRVGNVEAQRDFTDVRDVVRAYRLLMERGVFGDACSTAERQRGVCGVYHVASGRAVSISTVLDTLLSYSSVPITIEKDPERLRSTDTSILVGDATKLRTATGWEPQIPLEQTLLDVLEWWRAQVH